MPVDLIRAFEARGLVLKQGFTGGHVDPLLPRRARRRAQGVGRRCSTPACRIVRQASLRAAASVAEMEGRWDGRDRRDRGAPPIAMLGYWKRPEATAENTTCSAPATCVADDEAFVALLGGPARPLHLRGRERLPRAGRRVRGHPGDPRRSRSSAFPTSASRGGARVAWCSRPARRSTQRPPPPRAARRLQGAARVRRGGRRPCPHRDGQGAGGTVLQRAGGRRRGGGRQARGSSPERRAQPAVRDSTTASATASALRRLELREDRERPRLGAACRTAHTVRSRRSRKHSSRCSGDRVVQASVPIPRAPRGAPAARRGAPHHVLVEHVAPSSARPPSGTEAGSRPPSSATSAGAAPASS